MTAPLSKVETTPVTAEQLVALEERIAAALSREAQQSAELRQEVRDLIRTSIAAVRADIAHEVVTERLVVVDRYRRPWIETKIDENQALLDVRHPDPKLGLSAQLGVHDETFGGEAYVIFVADDEVLAELSAHGDNRVHPTDEDISIGSELVLLEFDGARDGKTHLFRSTREARTTITPTALARITSPDPAAEQ